jgi:hypothetical protein
MKNAFVVVLLLAAMGGSALAQEEIMYIPGDANFDGVVDWQDAAILAGHWGLWDVGWAEGDFNGDGRVDAADASILAAQMGYVAPSKPPVSANPEPATLIIWSVLGALGIAAGWWWKRKKLRSSVPN